MTEQQAKRMEEMAEKYEHWVTAPMWRHESKATPPKVGITEIGSHWINGYSACAKDAEVLVLILERIAWLEHYEPESATPSLLAGMAREALAKWRGE